MFVEFELSSPFLFGVADGWCSNWTQIPNSHAPSFWVNLSETQCWAHCDADTNCSQEVYESNGVGQCWTGTKVMTEAPNFEV